MMSMTVLTMASFKMVFSFPYLWVDLALAEAINISARCHNRQPSSLSWRKQTYRAQMGILGDLGFVSGGVGGGMGRNMIKS